MENLDYGATNHSVEGLDETFNPSKNSGSDILSIPTLMEQDHEQSQPRRSIREPIPRRQFDIEGEAFIIAPQHDEEPKTFSHALSGSKASEWIKAMKEEMESMKINQVGTWLIYRQDEDPLEINGFLKLNVRRTG
jgi:hypothetical protein